MKLMSGETNIDFMGKRFLAFGISACLIAFSIYTWIETKETKYGIDFVGGHSFTIALPGLSGTEPFVKALEQAGLSGFTFQSFEPGSNEYSLRIPLVKDLDSKTVRSKVEAALKEIVQDKYEILQTDSVGASISEEVRRNALIAVGIGLIGILIYVTVRFEFSFALGALVAVFHDVIVAVGVYLALGYALNGAALAAALTIVGYSVNDTIVIFDRVREEIVKRKEFDLYQLLNEAMNACLSRTIITSLLTFFSVFALLVFGGGAIKDLSVFLFAGIVSGVYSTIYIAAPVVLWWEDFRLARIKARAVS